MILYREETEQVRRLRGYQRLAGGVIQQAKRDYLHPERQVKNKRSNWSRWQIEARRQSAAEFLAGDMEPWATLVGLEITCRAWRHWLQKHGIKQREDDEA